MGGISGKLKRAIWPLVEVRARELETRRSRRKLNKTVKVCSILFAITILLSSAGITSAGPVNEDFEFIIENEWPSTTLTVQTTPVTGEVFVNENSWGPAPQTRRLGPGTYTVSFGVVEGYQTPDPEGVALDAGDHRTVVGVYTPISAPEPTSGGGGGGESNPDFSVSISPSSRTIARGESASYAVTIRSIDDFSGWVELSVSGAPGNSSCSMPSSVSVQHNGVSVSALKISTTGSTPTGDYTLTVTGTNGGLSRSASAELVITGVTGASTRSGTSGTDDSTQSGAEDFTVDISPDWKRVVNKIKVSDASSGSVETREVEEYGGGATAVRVNREAKYTVTVTSVNGFSGAVSLSVGGVPSGASSSTASSITVPRWGSASVSLTVTTTSSTPGGIGEGKCYTLTITGEHGGVTRSDSATLKVQEEIRIEGPIIATGPVHDGGTGSDAMGGGFSSRRYTVHQPAFVDIGEVKAVPNYVNKEMKDDAVRGARGHDIGGKLVQVFTDVGNAAKQAGSWLKQKIGLPFVNKMKEIVDRIRGILKDRSSIARVPFPVLPFGARF